MTQAELPRTQPAPVPRWHLAILALLVLVGMVRGVFWIVTIQVLNPIDEAQHLDYVAELWEEGEPPVVGEDLLDPAITEMIKSSPTAGAMSSTVSTDPTDEGWGAVAQSYEGVQPPLGYAVLVPTYAAARPFGMLPALYAVRLATLVVAMAAIPVAYALSREVLPRRPYAWLGAPLLLAFVQGTQSNLASVTNDALVLPLGAALLLPVARAARRGPTTRQAIVLGVLGGAALLTKATTLILAPTLLLGAIVVGVRWRPRWPRGAVWLGSAVGITTLISAPWWWWNLTTYGALTAGERTDLITGPLQPQIDRTFGGLFLHLQGAMAGFWDLQPHTAAGAYRHGWFVVLGVLTLLGTVVAIARRRWTTAAMLPWLGSAAVLGSLMMVVLIATLTGGAGTVVGRHLYPTLVAVLAAGACGLGVLTPGRWFAGIAVGLVAVAAWAEVPVAARYVDVVYTAGLTRGGLAPVVDQRWNDGWVDPEAAVIAPPCPAEVVDLTFEAEPPRQLALAEGATIPLVDEPPSSAGRTGRYRLPEPTTRELTIELPGPERIGHSDRNRTTQLALVGADGDPLASVYCEVEDPRAFRFQQLHGPQHPDVLSYGDARAWFRGWRSATTAAAVIALLTGVVRAIRLRRGGRDEDGDPPDRSDQDVA